MMLSPHFSREEFEQSATARARGIQNIMPDALVPAARALCVLLLEPIRAQCGGPIILSSGYRSRAVNRAVGSHDTSQHRRGEAADIVPLRTPGQAELARWIAASDLPFDQLILEGYRRDDPHAGWIHVSHAVGRPQRRHILTMTLAGHGPVYREGLPG